MWNVTLVFSGDAGDPAVSVRVFPRSTRRSFPRMRSISTWTGRLDSSRAEPIGWGYETERSKGETCGGSFRLKKTIGPKEGEGRGQTWPAPFFRTGARQAFGDLGGRGRRIAVVRKHTPFGAKPRFDACTSSTPTIAASVFPDIPASPEN